MEKFRSFALFESIFMWRSDVIKRVMNPQIKRRKKLSVRYYLMKESFKTTNCSQEKHTPYYCIIGISRRSVFDTHFTWWRFRMKLREKTYKQSRKRMTCFCYLHHESSAINLNKKIHLQLERLLLLVLCIIVLMELKTEASSNLNQENLS